MTEMKVSSTVGDGAGPCYTPLWLAMQYIPSSYPDTHLSHPYNSYPYN